MRLVFAGTPEVAVTSLEALLASRHDVVAVLSRPDAPAGRGRAWVESPVARLARERGIDVIKPASLRDGDTQRQLRELAPDCAPVVAYGGLVPAEALAIPLHGWVNLHFSLLPAWRGAAPVQRALWNGDHITGASTFLLEEGLDTGPVFGAVTEPIEATDTSGVLLERLAVRGASLLVATLDAIDDGTAVAVPQVGEPSLAPKLTVEESRLKWDAPAHLIDRQARACTPAPGAWTTFRDERLGLGPVLPLDDAPVLAPGALRVLKNEVQVGTGSVPVRLGMVRAAGKREMPAADWARGLRLTDSDVLV